MAGISMWDDEPVKPKPPKVEETSNQSDAEPEQANQFGMNTRTAVSGFHFRRP
jgi:hypothetical protein